MKRLAAIRYVSPLREGGSLPAIVEANDNRLYVMKFRGAGQGRKALIAELIAGEIARALDLRVPEIVLMDLDAALGQAEPDPEISDLLEFSVGLNLAMAYLPSALMFELPAASPPDPRLASSIVWFDAFVTNVDRTARNSNILVWNRQFWLIDHGASLYFHHAWENNRARSRQPFPHIKDHILLRFASELRAVDETLSARLSAEKLLAFVSAIPDDWLTNEPGFETAAQVRAAYLTWLQERLAAPRVFVEEALNARAARV
ncbi:MAG: HipA family kinase [Chloroflexota bacterium]